MWSHLGSRDAQEAYGHEHSSDRDLVIAKLDSIEILYTETVRCNQTVQSEDLVHLDGGNKGASSLPDNRGNWGKKGQFEFAFGQ